MLATTCHPQPAHGKKMCMSLYGFTEHSTILKFSQVHLSVSNKSSCDQGIVMQSPQTLPQCSPLNVPEAFSLVSIKSWLTFTILVAWIEIFLREVQKWSQCGFLLGCVSYLQMMLGWFSHVDKPHYNILRRTEKDHVYPNTSQYIVHFFTFFSKIDQIYCNFQSVFFFWHSRK